VTIATKFGMAHTNAAIGVMSAVVLALRPEFSAQARMPPRLEARATGGFDCGASGVHLPALTHRSGGLVSILRTLGGLALFLSRGPNRGPGRLEAMTRTEHEQAAPRRGELAHARGAQRLLQAVDARRRLNTRPADGARITADPHTPNDPPLPALISVSADADVQPPFRPVSP
jgi:hypothetical protein